MRQLNNIEVKRNMNKIFSVAVILAGWIISHFLIMFHNIAEGILVVFFGVALGAVLWLRTEGDYWKRFWLQKLSPVLPVIFVSLAVFVAILGGFTVRILPKMGMILFIMSGLFLMFSKIAGKETVDFFGIPQKEQPAQKWEPWFVFLLLLVSGWLRLYKVGDIPPVGYGYEGLIMAACDVLDRNNTIYMPHYGGGTDWPTLTYYIGIFFAKIFGWNLGSFRVTSGILGTLSIIIFYFLARRITSPLPAAIMSVMFSVFTPHMSISRTFASPATLLFIPHMLCLYLLFVAASRPRWYLFLAAGLAGGYSLHGYVPGRGVLVLFMAWFILMFITRQKFFHKTLNFFIFWAGFFLISSPVVVFAIKNPDVYWGYVISVDPNKGKGIFAYLKYIFKQIPAYSGMFFTKSGWDTAGLHFSYKPLLNVVSSVLFAPSLVLCLFLFWRPIPSILLILFFGGVMPSMLAAGEVIQPNAGRTLLSFPVIFLFGTLFLEMARRVFRSVNNKYVYVFFICACIISSLWVFQDGTRQYFKLMKSPQIKVNHDHQFYLMYKEIMKYPDAELYITPFFDLADVRTAFYPRNKPIKVVKYIGRMLYLNRQDSLIFLPPFYVNTADIFKECFPNAIVTIHRETKEGENDPYYTSTQIHPSGRKHISEFVPFIFLISVFIPKQDIEDFQTMLFMENNGNWERVKVFGDFDFGKKYAGKYIVLKGAFLIRDLNTLCINRSDPVVFKFPWNGWKFVLNGKAQSLNKTVFVGSGLHFFEISGTVPAKAKGNLPLEIIRGDSNLVDEGKVLAIKNVFGTRIFINRGFKNWDEPFSYRRRLIVPNTRFYDEFGPPMPFSLIEKSLLIVPESGEYEIKAGKNNYVRINVNGKCVYEYDSFTKEQIEKVEKVFLTKSTPAQMETYYSVMEAPFEARVLPVLIKSPGAKDFVMAPYSWFYPED